MDHSTISKNSNIPREEGGGFQLTDYLQNSEYEHCQYG